MRRITTIQRYIFFELFPPFAVNMFFFTFILLISRILEITNMVVNYQAGLASIFLLLFYSMPFFLAFVTPMSVMMAVLLTFLRLSGDNEVTALKSCGVSPNHFLAPVALFCLLGWLLTTLITNWMMPWANRSFHGLSADLAQSHINAVIKERTFIDSFNGIMLYVSQVDLQNQTLVDVFIEDQRAPNLNNIIVAPRGRIAYDPLAQKIRLKLFDGAINRVDLENQGANAINFETYEMSLDIKQLHGTAVKNLRPLEEMSWSELRQYIKNIKIRDKRYYKALMKFHEKLALPAACLALGLLALPLGLQTRSDKRSIGMVMGIGLFLLYYVVLSVGWALGESGTLPPVLGMWAPNVMMTATGIYLHLRAVQDRPLLPDRLTAIFILKLPTIEKDTQDGPPRGKAP
jgi:lipopolysaccharide export system permease protein